jgi:division/cell wall cluster transcriptional repressor MraZ
MTMPLRLTGSYRLKLDAKGRISIPVEHRRLIEFANLGASFYFTIGSNGKLWGHPSVAYEEWLDTIPREMNPESPQLDYVHLHAAAIKTAWDDQGRIVIPADLLAEANVGEDVAFVGALDHVEIWRFSDWTDHRAKIWKGAPDIVRKWKNSTKTISAPPLENARAGETFASG